MLGPHVRRTGYGEVSWITLTCGTGHKLQRTTHGMRTCLPTTGSVLPSRCWQSWQVVAPRSSLPLGQGALRCRWLGEVFAFTQSATALR